MFNVHLQRLLNRRTSIKRDSSFAELDDPMEVDGPTVPNIKTNTQRRGSVQLNTIMRTRDVAGRFKRMNKSFKIRKIQKESVREDSEMV